MATQFNIQPVTRTPEPKGSRTEVASALVEICRWGKRSFEEPERAELRVSIGIRELLQPLPPVVAQEIVLEICKVGSANILWRDMEVLEQSPGVVPPSIFGGGSDGFMNHDSLGNQGGASGPLM